MIVPDSNRVSVACQEAVKLALCFGLQSEAVERLELDEAFDPIRLGLGDIDKGLAVTVDEVRYVVVKIGRAKCDAPENGLLEAGIVTDALFRLQIRIGEKIERREAHKQLLEGRGL